MPSDKEILDYLKKKDKENPAEVDEEVKLVKAIREKYNVTVEEITLVTLVLMKMGFGRNQHTADILKAVSEMIESPIKSKDTIVAEMEGKLQ